MYIKSQEGKRPKKDQEEDVPKWDDMEDLDPADAVVRGAGQGVTLGFLDELKAMLGTSGASPSEVVAQPKLAEEKEREMFQQYESQLAEERAIDEALKKAYPNAYMGGELAGGLVPSLGTGGAAAAGKVLKEGTKQAMKEAAKLGAKYGGTSAAGYSEADNPIDLAKDVAVGTGSGAAIGAGLPLAGKGLKEAGKAVKGGAESVFDILPKSEQMKAAFKYGRQGKSLDQGVIDKDLKSLGKKVLKNINKKKKANRLDEVIEQLDDMGYKVDTKKAVEDAVEDLEKLAKGDLMGQQNKELLPRLQELLGKDKQTAKMVNQAEKKALKKAIEGKSKAEQSIIKGEKALAKEQIKTGDELETITDINRSMDDLDLPLDTQKGQIGGVKGKFKDAEGNEYTKTVLADDTPYQPSMSVQKGPDGRPVVTTKDLGSGKIEALVGDIETKIMPNLDDMKVSEVELLRRQLNEATGLAAGQGSAKDPVVQRAMKLAQTLKDLTDEAVRKGGDDALIDRRATFSDMFTAEELLGVRKMLNPRRDVDTALKADKIASELGFNKPFIGRTKSEMAKDMLGEDVVTPEMDKQFQLLKMINEIVGRGEMNENVSRAGVYQMAAGKLPNVIGRATKGVENIAKKVTSPVTMTTKMINEMGDDRLTQVSNNMLSSSSEGTQLLGQRLQEALNLKGQAKNAAMWSLSQNPAFRDLVNRQTQEFSEDMSEDLGITEPPKWDDMEDIEEELSGQISEETGREPNAVKDIDEGLEHILDVEAGYQAQEADRGNFLDGQLIGTNRGITPAAYKAYYGTTPTVEDMKNLTKEQALEIYKNDYVNDPGFGEIADPNLQTSLVDYGVNSGPVRAIKAIQKIVGAEPDGRLGPKTIELINNYEGDLNSQLMDARREFIKKIDNPKYEKGWLNRIDHMEEVTSPEEVEAIEKEIDRVNQQQSSGEQTPVSHLDELLGKINEMGLAQEDADRLEDEAMSMDGYGDGARLKEMIRKMSGQS